MADTKVFLSGNRIQGRSDDSVLTAIPQTSWKELDRVTLGSTSDTIDTGTFSAKDNLKFLLHVIRSGSVTVEMTFNADTGSNYAKRLSETGESDGTNVNQNYLKISIDNEDDEFHIMDFRNIANREKLGIIHVVARQSGTGAGNAPTRGETVGKWANTADQITRVTLTNTNGGDYASGCELIVLGCDDDEADSGTNFWQELTNTSTIASSVTNTSGTFTAKKYMMFTAHTSSINNSNHGNSYLRLGSSGSIDTGSNYAFRGSINGASDGTGTSNSSGIFAEDYWSSGGGDHGGILYNGYIMNVSGKEKLVIMEVVQGMNGASNPPRRQEPVGKWANTSAQANVLQINAAGGGGLLAGSWRVWGSD